MREHLAMEIKANEGDSKELDGGRAHWKGMAEGAMVFQPPFSGGTFP